MKKIISLILSTIFLVISLAACSNTKVSDTTSTNSKETSSASTAPKETNSTSTDSKETDTTTKNSKDQSITLYFSDSNAQYTVGEQRTIKDVTPQKAIQALIEGPQNKELKSLLPKELVVSKVVIKDGIAQVYIQQNVPKDKRGNYGTSTATSHIINSIAATLIKNEQFGIKKVKLEGNIGELLYGIDTSKPFDVDMNLIKSK